MTNELWAFLAAIICGMGAVVLWNIFEVLRNALRAKAFINIVLDILWWVVFCVTFSICMWQIFNLDVRAFEFIGVALGAFLCHILFARPIRYIAGIIFGIILKIIQFIFKILLTPGAFLYKILVEKKSKRMRKKIGKVAKNESPQEKTC